MLILSGLGLVRSAAYCILLYLLRSMRLRWCIQSGCIVWMRLWLRYARVLRRKHAIWCKLVCGTTSNPHSNDATWTSTLMQLHWYL